MLQVQKYSDSNLNSPFLKTEYFEDLIFTKVEIL